jgi:hypothetical protein
MDSSTLSGESTTDTQGAAVNIKDLCVLCKTLDCCPEHCCDVSNNDVENCCGSGITASAQTVGAVCTEGMNRLKGVELRKRRK